LKDELLSIRRKIRFRVLAARRELFDVGEMALGRLGRLPVYGKASGSEEQRERSGSIDHDFAIIISK
jgi:hypothetical protein